MAHSELLLSVVVIMWMLKFLVLYGYRSTDFEVHRNWLAITYSLPIEKWYQDNTSQWTLDYPPFFAYFERTLSLVAPFFDPGMLRISEQPYASFETVLFQRLTVICTELLFVYASLRLSKQLAVELPAWTPSRITLAVVTVQILSITNVGIFFVDNIHFQYNGFLLGVLILSIAFLMEGNVVLSSIMFASLLYLKHIFLYVAPAFFAVMLRCYCFDLKPGTNIFRHLHRLKMRNLAKLAVSIVSVTFLALGPFLYRGGVEQISLMLARLFPFKRGLTHAYWAPNIWALYNVIDFSLFHILRLLGSSGLVRGTPGYVTGLVQEFDHCVLPTIAPRTTAILFLTIATPVFVLTVLFGWQRRTFFIRAITWFAFASFMTGWHVHEKAILMVIIPFAFLAIATRKDCKLWTFVSIIGHVSLTPLLFTGFEIMLKHCLLWLSIAITVKLTTLVHPQPSGGQSGWSPKMVPCLGALDNLYLYVILALAVMVDVVPTLPVIARYEFLPLMALSSTCAVGLLVAFTRMTIEMLSKEWGLDCLKRWNFRRRQTQLKLAISETDSIELTNLLADATKFNIAGFDMTTLDGDDSFAVATVAVLEYPSLKVIEAISESFEITEEYRAGFLAFREVGPLLHLYQESKRKHDIKICFIDGNGLLHPNGSSGCGLACHFGVLANIPTVGVAKNLHHVDESVLKHKRDFQKELISPGQSSPLIARDGRLLGAALRATKESINPIFVSIGHGIALDTAVRLTSEITLHRVPEPIRMADQVSRAEVRKLQEKLLLDVSKAKRM